MQIVSRMKGLLLALLAGMQVLAASADAKASLSSDGTSLRLSRKERAGSIAVRAGKKQFPQNAAVSLSRTREDSVQGKIRDGLAKKRQGAKSNGAGRGRLLGASAATASSEAKQPRVLAMYDISIGVNGKKWQPDAGDPVRVTVDLEEPVAIASDSTLGVVHLADDGTVEELSAGNYGFTYNADKTQVTSFWFSAEGFSVYSIIDSTGTLVTPRRFYHFYSHPSAIDGTNAVQTLPYKYMDQSNDVVNVQIVKTGDQLKEPPIPEDIIDEEQGLVSVFEGWYVVHTETRPSTAVEAKLDSETEPFKFVWPVGVTDNRLAVTGTVTVTESVDTDYYVVPLFEHARFIQFCESEMAESTNGANIVDRKLVAINDETGVAHIKVSDISAALKNSRQEYFCGWTYKSAADGTISEIHTYDAEGQPTDAYIDVDDNLFQIYGGDIISLWPLYVEAHFLNFDTNAKGTGATYIGSIFVRQTSEFTAVPVSERKGYDFVGWCYGTVDGNTVTLGTQVTDSSGNILPNLSITDEDGKVVIETDANGVIKIHADITLFAKWKASSSATYRVVVWQQKISDSKDAADSAKKYNYVTHYTSPEVDAETAVAESMVTSFTGTDPKGGSLSGKDLTAISGIDNITGTDFTGFHFGRIECDDDEIASDDSTVINVYYDRDLVTLRFCLYDSSQSQTIYTMNASSTDDGLVGTEDGENYFDVYYNSSDGKWYKTKTEAGTTYTYSTEHTGTRYYKLGNSYKTTTSNEGTQYRKSSYGNNYYEIYYNSADGKWYRSRTETTAYAFSDVYTGYRYTSSTTHWIVNQEMTGLYGQTLAFNGYEWPKTRKWYESYSGSSADGTNVTFMDAFLPTSGGDSTFYSSSAAATSGGVIYFYKEALDGSWVLANEVVTGTSSGTFYLSDKYSGFTCYQYSSNGGSWKDVGTYDESTHYYGSSVSYSSSLSIRFKRNEYAIVYNDGDDVVYETPSNELVPFESPLTAYDLSPTNSLLSWTRDTTQYTFDGWYEDASLTKAFDFSSEMPAATKMLYAKWSPIKYKVIIDPNGGQLAVSDSTWFYLDADELITEYYPTRNYYLDMQHGTYYYHYSPWKAENDKHTDDYNPANSNASRRAYYTDDVSEATDTVKKYSYDQGAYSFMGWYEVLEDGTVSNDPFNFNEPVNREITLRAIWRRTGIYTLRYESVDPDGIQETQYIYDPEQGVEGGYIDDGETTLARDPTNYDREKWIWEGWQVVDKYNNIPLTNIRSPGDLYIVHSAHADYRDNVIYFKAVYSLRDTGDSRHVPNVVDFVLDSNEDATVDADEVTSIAGRKGAYTDGVAGKYTGLNQGVWFAGQQNNFSINLADYSSKFTHDKGYLLLGWDTNRYVTSGVPAFRANETIGIDKTKTSENILYAVWEPQIYIDFTNATDAAITDIQFDIPSWTEGNVYEVPFTNGEYDIYSQEAFTNFENGTATFSLAAGEARRFVVPDGEAKVFSVTGPNPFPGGNKLTVTRVEPEIEGVETEDDYVSVAYSGENYLVAGTMYISPTPTTVTFTKTTYKTDTTVPVRYFIHTVDGTIQEITDDADSWATTPLKTFTVGSATNDIAKTLRKSSTEGVHECLAEEVAKLYGHTTIGIGAKTGDFEEYRTITKEGPEGGSYLRYYHEQFQWARYGVVWNNYDADSTAVYVVFYKRIPVHVTIANKVIGTDEDLTNNFSYTASFTPHSKTAAYTITTTYTKTIKQQRSGNWYSGYTWTDTNDPDWEFSGITTNATLTLVDSLTDKYLFSAREDESFTLQSGGRHPLTIYYSASEESADNDTKQSSSIGDEYTSGGWLSSTTYRDVTYTQTQTVTMHATYKYETVVVKEADSGKYTLISIDGDPTNPLASHSGTDDFENRTYTVSSMRDDGSYDYTPLDTAIFENKRKTGDLTIKKTVNGGEEGDVFHFVVTLGETVVDKANYVAPAGVHLGPLGQVFNFALTNSTLLTMTLPGLPAGASYTVEEVANSKYVSTAPANASGTIVEAGTSVTFVNTRKTDVAIVMNSKEVSFNNSAQAGYDISEVTGTGRNIVADGYTVTGLKAGHVMTVQHHVAANGTKVGTYTGSFLNAKITIADASGNDVTGEYIVSATPGSLTIVGSSIIVTVSGNTSTVAYDGNEHSCDGHTNIITHATTGAVIEDSAIVVAIDPQYQSVTAKNVGKHTMYITPDVVVVTVPDGYTVADIVVAEVGYLQITPAAATVTANSLSKIHGFSDPELTATVTGLIGSDTITYTVTREAGEDVGTYAITVSGEAEQGNYTVSYVAGTFEIKNLELTQRSTDTGVPLDVPVTEELVEAIVGDGKSEDMTVDEISDLLNSWDENGLRRWENLVTGTATNQLLLSTKTQISKTQLSVGLTTADGKAMDLGYEVLYELRKQNSGKWERVAGPVASDGEATLDVPLVDDEGKSQEPTGLYRVTTLIVPTTDHSITNEIMSTNTIGVLEVASSITNTVIAVPWKQLASDPVKSSNITVSNLVASVNLTPGDSIYAVKEESNTKSGSSDSTYEMWTMNEDGTWGSVETFNTKSAAKGGSVAEAAGSKELARTKAVWLQRQNPLDADGNPVPFYLIGQYESNGVEITVTGGTDSDPGYTLISVPDYRDFQINELDWGDYPVKTDFIRIVDGSQSFLLKWSNGKWCKSTAVYRFGRYAGTKFTEYKTPLKAGTGFWFCRHGDAFTIKWTSTAEQ